MQFEINSHVIFSNVVEKRDKFIDILYNLVLILFFILSIFSA